MVAILDTAVEPLERDHMVLHNISWQTFERILDEMGECHYRVTYDNGELEFMTTSFSHENFGEWIGRLTFFAALEMNLAICSGGSTTFKRAARKVGLEPDQCFWIKHESAMRGKKKWNALKDPPPDLAVEIDITSSWLDRLGIYAALEVPEVWRFDGESLKVLILSAGGKYKEKTKSLSFPFLPLDDFERFVKKLGSKDEGTLLKEFCQWLRTAVATKMNGAERRKNGK